MRVLARNIVIFTLATLIFVVASEATYRMEKTYGFNYAQLQYVMNVAMAFGGMATAGFILLEIWHNAQAKLKLLERSPESGTRSTMQSQQSG